MDIYIRVTDENEDLVYSREIYRDGSDSEGAEKIRDAINVAFGKPASHELGTHVGGGL